MSCKRLKLFLAITICFPIYSLYAEEGMLSPLINNIINREYQSLSGDWKTIVDPFENGYYDYRMRPSSSGYFLDRSYRDKTVLQEYDFDDERSLVVPGDWNTQRPELYYYEGTIWYRKKILGTSDQNRKFLYFGAANYDAKVYLNGEFIGSHIGGFTPFNIEVTNRLHIGDNSLVVKVDNKRMPNGVPTVNSDWWNYGGLTREVLLVSVARSFIRDYFIHLDPTNSSLIKGWVQLDPPLANEKVTINIPELKIKQTINLDNKGVGYFKISSSKIKLWQPNDPKLYDILLTSSSDSIKDQIGFRTIETKGTDILLNGKKIFCRGVCLHEEAPFKAARSYSEQDAEVLLGWVKEMGANFVRLAHYPHNEAIVRMAERMGIMVWSEIPVYWTIHWSDPSTYANAQNQLIEMISRDKNRANVIVWSVANETPNSADRLSFLSRLIAKTREMDPTRLVTAAMEKEEISPKVMTVHDPLSNIVDLISFNQYVGWYDGNWSKCDSVSWTFDVKKPVFISEFGAGVRYNHHGDSTEYFTEEYAQRLYQKSIDMLRRIPGLSGTTPWILKDFRSARRVLPGIQDDFNRKGLISEKGEKKKAFYVMQKWYNQMINHK